MLPMTPEELYEIDDIERLAPQKVGEQITVKSAEIGREDVMCSPGITDGENSEEEGLVSFPEEAWQGPFAIWRDIACPSTESPQEYLWLSCLVTLGLVLGRNVVI